MDKHKCFEEVHQLGNLHRAFRKSRKGKRHKDSVAKFEANLLEALCLLSAQLEGKRYKPSEYFSFWVYEPKKRLVMTNAFKDKVVQHALCDNVLQPLFMNSFVLDNYASQPDKGQSLALDRLSGFMRSYFFERKARTEAERRAAGLPLIPVERGGYADGWVLKADVTKYFYSIQHEPLKRLVRDYIRDTDVLWLLDLIIDSTTNPGIPIGNQTSQWLAVLYLNALDHFVKEKLGCKRYGRYMDDFYIIHEDKEYLRHCRREIERLLSALGLTPNNKTNIFPLRNGIRFLGFRTFLTDTGKVVRKLNSDNKCKRRRILRKQRALLDEGATTLAKIEQSYGSWRSHAEKGDSHHLVRDMDRYFKTLFKESEKVWHKQ